MLLLFSRKEKCIMYNGPLGPKDQKDSIVKDFKDTAKGYAPVIT